jgi:FMN phosphatase YigB (HAD superfamily)
VPAPQTLFIDDIEANIAAARSVGIRGIVFHSAQDLEVDLKPYGLAQSLAEARTLAG